MSKINYHRKNKKPVNLRYSHYHNGFGGQQKTGNFEERDRLREEGITLLGVTGGGGSQRVGKTDFLDKSMHGWGRLSKLADVHVGACIPNDFTNGHRGMAKAVRGAKKFVRTRTRFHENAATKKLNIKEDQE